MSKAKLSFSFLLSLVLVGMLSIVAFAATPVAPTELKFTSPTKDTVTVTWKAVDEATGYKIYWNGSTTAEDSATPTYTKSGLEQATTYTVEVAAVNADGESAKTAFKVVLHNGTVPTKDLTKPDNNISNAHKTGEGNLIKNPDGQMKNDKTTNGAHKLHGSYQNNTNSCASCHQTHTAASKSLLFKNGAYNTCTACHDGTLGFYNVFGTSNADDMGAGTFGGTHDGNMSVHMSTGALEISAAPGSNSKVTGATWTGEFTCASCHDPHGSFSDRLLAVNPNGMATVERKVAVDGDGKPSTVYGNKLMNVPVQKTAPTGTINAQSLNDYFFKDLTIAAADIAAGGYYEMTGLKVGDRVLQLQRYIGGSWKNAPGVYLRYTGTARTSYWPKMYNDTTLITVNEALATAGTYWFNNTKAYFKVPTAEIITKISEVQKAYTVDLLEVTTDKLGNAIPSKAGVQPTRTLNGYLTTAGKGMEFNEWCGSCHVDYFTRTKYSTGVDQNYTHHSMSDNYNCARCHYAHGTDAKIMSDANGRTYETLQTQGGFTTEQAKEYLKDVNASSALKRYTNMAVCYGCHTSSHSEGFINNNDYNTTDSLNGFITDSNEFKGKKLIPTP
ncbi:cytochrome c3 family protein [Bacillus sp. FJAT-27445]|uniref:cytochrome c3 family protein n=1 Tax=Bacillus sp. FJAT-27445 TaxID=1679166 RepID=UPI000743E43A|nr:cytochrome c3 family protein [Bacillus sp. FJAT-27445]